MSGASVELRAGEPLLRVENLVKHFPVTRGVLGQVVGQVRAVDGISFTLARGETLGLVGESGSGKTTAGRSILRLIEPTSGQVFFDGSDVLAANPKQLRGLRRQMQIIFQDPYGSLNPRMRVVDLVGEAIERHGLLRGAAVEERVADLMKRVGLSPAWLHRYPHEFSGGQRQRIGVARALALEPKLIVCDEPVSALDVSIQAQVVNLLKGLGRDLGLSYLFIAHDLSVVRHISHRVAVMYLGEIVELAETRRLFAAPAHPYTRALLSAIPVPDPTRERARTVLTGDIPSPLNPPNGCRFHTRCPAVFERCRSEAPEFFAVEPGHRVRCFHAESLTEENWTQQLEARILSQMAKNRPAIAAPTLEWLESARPAGLRDRRPTRAPTSPTRKPLADSESLAPRNTGLLILLALVMVVGFAAAARRAAQERETRQILLDLGAAIEAQAQNTGSVPASLHELGWRLPAIFRGRPPLDPWGRSILYRKPDAKHSGVSLKSLGADGVTSHDDLTLEIPNP